MINPYLALLQSPEGKMEFRGVVAENAEQAFALITHLLVENGLGETLIINVLSEQDIQAFQGALDQIKRVIAENPLESIEE